MLEHVEGRPGTCAKAGGDEEAALGFATTWARPNNVLSATKLLNKTIKF